jgi:hypothetical protein
LLCRIHILTREPHKFTIIGNTHECHQFGWWWRLKNQTHMHYLGLCHHNPMPPTESIIEVECLLIMCPQFHHILRFHIKLISFIMIFILTNSAKPLIMCNLNLWASSTPQRTHLSHQNAYMAIHVAKLLDISYHPKWT